MKIKQILEDVKVEMEIIEKIIPVPNSEKSPPKQRIFPEVTLKKERKEGREGGIVEVGV